MNERIRNLSVSEDCYIPLRHGIGTTVTCLRNPQTKAKFWTVEIVRHNSVIRDKFFYTLDSISEWYKEMLNK